MENQDGGTNFSGMRRICLREMGWLVVLTLVAPAGGRAQPTLARGSDIAATLIRRHFEVDVRRPLLTQTLSDIHSSIPATIPVGAGFAHQLWGARAADGTEVVFAIAADASEYGDRPDSVSAVEISFATPDVSQFRREWSRVLRAARPLGRPALCTRQTAAVNGGLDSVLTVSARWTGTAAGTVLTAIVPVNIPEPSSAHKRRQFAIRLRSYKLSDTTLAPSMPIDQPTTTCLLSSSDMRDGRR